MDSRSTKDRLKLLLSSTVEKMDLIIQDGVEFVHHLSFHPPVKGDGLETRKSWCPLASEEKG